MPVDLTNNSTPLFFNDYRVWTISQILSRTKIVSHQTDVVMYRRVAIKVTTKLFSSEVGGSEKNPLRLVFWIEIRFDRLEKMSVHLFRRPTLFGDHKKVSDSEQPKQLFNTHAGICYPRKISTIL